jgi:2,5-dihydroxypyridine 5,6-dioxygenase
MSDWLEGNKARSDDMDGHAISHLGWGSTRRAAGTLSRFMAPIRNVTMRAPAGCFAGNFLFSTGPNSQGGGKRTTKGHYDVPMRDCTVALDNDVIIERGRFTDEKMQVAPVAR